MRNLWETKFWAKVDKTETCWNWTAYVTKYGYGAFRIGNAVCPAHRISYELSMGAIPDGLVIDHLCHNKRCVNASHMRIATRKQNGENRSGAQKNSASGIRGVSWNSRSRCWVAYVKNNGKQIHLGRFDNMLDAEKAAIQARTNLFSVSN